MVWIRSYKGYKIIYEDKQFFAEKKKEIVVKADNETMLLLKLDELIEKKKADDAKIKQEKTLQLKKQKLEKEIQNLWLTVNACDLYDMLNSVTKYIEEGFLRYCKGKLSILAMDPAKVLMAYRQCDCKGKIKEADIPLKLSNLKKIVKEKEIPRKKMICSEIILGAKISGETKQLVMMKETGDFCIPFEDYYDRDQKVPGLAFTTMTEIAANKFYRYMNEADKLFDSIVFEAKDGKLWFRGKDTDTMQEYNKEVGAYNGKDTKAKYSIHYLKLPYFDKKETLTLEFAKDYPMKMTDSKGNWIILAPRVDNY